MNRARGLAAFALAALAGVAPAQAPKPPRTVHTNRAAFSLPVKIDDRDRAELKELKFYVKAVQGGMPGEWVCKETAPPTQSKFTFRAAQDGEYWFSFVTVDKTGAIAPADLDKEPPGLVVVVDTKAPEIEVRPTQLATGEAILLSQVRDAHPEAATLRVEYQAPDRSWRALEAVPDNPGLFRVPSAAVLKGVVRASAADKAGNKATREIDLSQPHAGPAIAQTPVGTMLTSLTGPAPTPPAPTAVRTGERPAPPPAPEARPPITEPPAAPAARTMLNSHRCALDYALEAHNVTRVEAFATRDGGRTWTRVGEDADQRSPIEMHLPEEGVYGITLVVSTASQPGAAPITGDAPDLWVEVDTTKPEVLVHNIQAGSGAEARVLTLSWSMQDRNFAADAVEIHGAATADGPWQPLVRGLKEKGTVQCAVPPDLGARVFLRVQAADKAGNVGRWEAREPVLLEGARPKARVLGVSAGRVP